MATIVTSDIALNVPVNHFLLETSAIKIFISSSIPTLKRMNPPWGNLKLLFNQFNELTAESNKKNPENCINCRNLYIDEIQKMKIEPNSLPLFHINSCSSNENFKTLNIYLKLLKELLM